MLNKNMEKKVKNENKKSVNFNDNIRLLIENSISLQKVLTSMTISLDGLSKDVKKIVDLFEDANKAFEQGKRPGEGKTEKTEMKILHDKLNSLIEQNKVMANGIILLEGYLRESIGGFINPQDNLIKEESDEEEKIKRLHNSRF